MLPVPTSDSRPDDDLCRRFLPVFGLSLHSTFGLAHGRAGDSTQVPCPLGRVHDPMLFEAAWDRILRVLRNPAPVWIDRRGTRHVQVLGTGVYSTNADGMISIRLWELDRVDRPRLEVVSHDAISIDPLPFVPRLLARWEQWFALEVGHVARMRGLEASDQQVTTYARWAFKVYQSRIRRHCDMRWARTRVARVLALDPMALAVARQINLVERKSWASAHDYNRVIQDREANRRLMKDAPRLMLLFSVLTRLPDFPSEGEPLQRMRAYLLAHGRSPRCWRMLVKSGRPLLEPMVTYCCRPDAPAILGYLELLDAMQWASEPDAAFMDQVLALRGQPTEPRREWLPMFSRLMPTLRYIVRWFQSGDATKRAEILTHLHLVLDWLDMGGRADAHERRKHLSWSSLLQHASAWSMGRLLEHAQGSSRWPIPTDRLVTRDAEVVFISGAKALHEEAIAMRHCAFDYAADCASGLRIVASIRDPARGQRIATAMFIRTGRGLKVEDVAGFANRAVSHAVEQIARQIAELLNMRQT